MPKVALTCVMCGEQFEVWPARINDAERNGSTVRFCSRACQARARSEGLFASRPKIGHSIDCDFCKQPFWVQPKQKPRRFCSETCRQASFEAGMPRADRGQPRPIRLRGEEIACRFCGEVVYRKASMISRNIAITCGKPECVSAYGRSLWGLGPQQPELVGIRGPRRRPHNFTAKQRMDWLDGQCARCGAVKNLALDHIVPVCAGGQSVRENAQTLCQPCNNWKAKHVDRPLARQQNLVRRP